MVNHRDPAVIAQDTCAYYFAEKARDSEEPADFLRQGQCRSSGMSWQVFTCVSAPPRGPFALIAYPILLNSVLHFQLGIHHYSQLRVECNPKGSPVPLVDMGAPTFPGSQPPSSGPIPPLW
jgi:hypothetical protein